MSLIKPTDMVRMSTCVDTGSTVNTYMNQHKRWAFNEFFLSPQITHSITLLLSMLTVNPHLFCQSANQ